MSNVKIVITFNTKHEGHKFEVLPGGNDIDPAELGDRIISTLLDTATATMSAAGLAKWQIVENLQQFVDELESTSTTAFARSLQVVS